MNTALFVVICVAVFTASQTSGHRRRRFIGGHWAKSGQFPYLVNLRSITDDDSFCGGSIINKQFILTAAHCVEDEESEEIYVAAGSNSVYSWRDRYLVDSYVMHEDYDPFTLFNDIALIKLKRPIKFNKYIQKIPLYTLKDGPPAGSSMVISGFGRKYSFISYSLTLQYANVTAISPAKCIRMIRWYMQPHSITHGHICTFDGPKGFCNGDSGGPLVYEGKQVGIVSWGIGNCAKGFPDVYTRVASYKDWIRKTMDTMGFEPSTNLTDSTMELVHPTTELDITTKELTVSTTDSNLIENDNANTAPRFDSNLMYYYNMISGR